MTPHSFVDETKEPSYLMAAALIRPIYLSAARKCMSSLVLPGQRRIHFSKESDRRRAQIMRRLLEVPIEVVLFRASLSGGERAARHACLAALVRDHVDRNVRRLVIERDDTVVDFDRSRLQAGLRAANAVDRLTYEHMRAHEEPLLAIADAVAWCWGKGGHWRVKAKGLVTDVIQA